MSLEPREFRAYSQRGIPSQVADSTVGPLRSSKRGELITQVIGKPLYALADEGSYFVASNPTPGTGIVGIAAADGWNPLESLLTIQNTAKVSEGIRMYLDFLEIACTVVDTNGTNVRWDMHIDSGSRWTSGGSTITPVSPNMDVSSTTKAAVHFGALVSPAATSDVRYLGGRLVSSTDLVADDTLRFNFGGADAGSVQDLSSAEHATLNTRIVESVPPVILGPLDSFLFSINCASQSGGATWSFRLGYWER